MKKTTKQITLFLFLVCATAFSSLLKAQATYIYIDENNNTNKIHFQQERGTWTIQLYSSTSNKWYFATIISSNPDKGYFKFKDGSNVVYEAKTYNNGECWLKAQNYNTHLVYKIENQNSSTQNKVETKITTRKIFSLKYDDGSVYKLCFQPERGNWTVQVYDSGSNQWNYATVKSSNPSNGYFKFLSPKNNELFSCMIYTNGKCELLSEASKAKFVYWEVAE